MSRADLEHRYNNMFQKFNWISCSERMPGVYNTVLIAHEDGHVACAEYLADSHTSLTWDPQAASKVTHWRDLPPHPDWRPKSP